MYVGKYEGLRESGPFVFRKLCTVVFLVVVNVRRYVYCSLMIVHVELSTLSDCIVC